MEFFFGFSTGLIIGVVLRELKILGKSLQEFQRTKVSSLLADFGNRVYNYDTPAVYERIETIHVVIVITLKKR